MTSETVAPVRQTAEDGSRFYEWPDPTTGETRPFWSVTTALSALNKDGLKWWSAKLAARRAMDNLPMLLASQRVDPCGRTHARTEPLRCERCPECVQRWVELFHVGESERRKHEGSAVHDALEAGILHGWDAIPEPVELGQKYLERHPGIVQALPPYLASLRRWIDDYALQPEDFQASEMTIFNEQHEYGGTLDAILRLVARNGHAAKMIARISGKITGEAVDVVLDCKSREGEGKAFYGEHALQLTPYRRATHCMPDKVSRVLRPMPVTDGAAVLQVRPDGYTFEPIRTGPEEFDAFLAALEMFRWTVEHESASIAVKSFPVPEGFAFSTAGTTKPPPKKRAPRKAAVKPTTATPTVPARIKGATLEGLANSRIAGDTLTDADIPF